MPWLIATAADSYRVATEDRVAAWPTAYGLLVAVADGMGGRAGGAAAANFVIRHLEAHARWPAFPTPDALAELLRQIDRDAAAQSGGGETTAIVCALTESEVSGAAVGDSAAWWVTATAVQALTVEAVRKPWVGSGSANPLPFAVPNVPGTLLLMTDGVWEYADPAVLRDIARGDDLATIPARLIDAARMRTGQLQDDAALVVARRN
ncbi:MAG TPA: protein phosphatase 2C domain-containing protein [Gemmataceae bacterium]|nr:protein phosphatase 2C domain-containing protein [Gemmataceae bacterium]